MKILVYTKLRRKFQWQNWEEFLQLRMRMNVVCMYKIEYVEEQQQQKNLLKEEDLVLGGGKASALLSISSPASSLAPNPVSSEASLLAPSLL